MPKDEKSKEFSRRKFLKSGLAVGAGTFIGGGLLSSCSKASNITEEKKTEMIKLLTTDGRIVEVEKTKTYPVTPSEPTVGDEARKGIPGRKFVMVIDLSRCANAGKCTSNCQSGHKLDPGQEYMSVHLMKDHKYNDPYWFPKNCYHCDNPSCVKVCPVGATFKRSDGCVLIDVDRCIGCKFCISACPYSARIFNWKERINELKAENAEDEDKKQFSPETSLPAQMGTVTKCDFCPDMSRQGKLPYCVTGCPMGAIYFGDENEDAISNGTETLRFKQTLKEKAGYRYLEELGTQPRVYYLPPVNKSFPYEVGLKDLTDEQKLKYKNILDKS
ncbi:MAG: 4Fe-4S binding protein [Bacteroidales bacterium]|nr:4Fe-4S binding protein [Bacteroidales bacterium]MBN2755897.1 4Fe-4S binding protein [Bacteroidales bacterium]